ncbi:hypothetical protein pb186bvf_019098 [Paramecium bursaria]
MVKLPTQILTQDKDHYDIFGLKTGLTELAPKKSEFEPTSLTSNPLTNAFNSEKPTIDQELKSDQAFEDYGNGFQLRFLTVYPYRLLTGKNKAQYFVSRLTQNNQQKKNDRLLTIWYGLGFYQFTTSSQADNNLNLAKNIDTPDDIQDDKDIFHLSRLKQERQLMNEVQEYGFEFFINYLERFPIAMNQKIELHTVR